MCPRTSTRLVIPLLVAVLLAPPAGAGPLSPAPEPDGQGTPHANPPPPPPYGQDVPPPDPPPYAPDKPSGKPPEPPYEPDKPPGQPPERPYEPDKPPAPPPGEEDPDYGGGYYYDDEEPDDGPPEPPPAPPLPAKVVRVQFCVVDDGSIFPPVPVDKSSDVNPGFPNARLGFPGLLGRDFALILGLLVKNALYARTGVSFAVAAPTVYIRDPHPNTAPFIHGGELGDVAEPAEDDLRFGYPDIPTSISFPGEAVPSMAPPRGKPNPPAPSWRRSAGTAWRRCRRGSGRWPRGSCSRSSYDVSSRRSTTTTTGASTRTRSRTTGTPAARTRRTPRTRTATVATARTRSIRPPCWGSHHGRSAARSRRRSCAPR